MMPLPSVDAFAPWQQRAWQQAVEALAADRLAHGLLLCGPALLGKRVLAERLAQRVLCLQPQDDAACGECRSCRLFEARTAPDAAEVRPDGTPAHPLGLPTHPDLYLLGHAINEKTDKPRSEIVIEQIRTLSNRLALTPQFGRAQVAIVDPADAINHAAANALLKTLEEPQPGRYLWLLSAHPAWLPATIRSRCQRLELRLPPPAEALAWLQQQGHAAAAAAEALEAARGHPGLAQTWLQHGGLQLRHEVIRDLQQLARGGTVVDVAQRWVADDQAAQRIGIAADWIARQAGQAPPDRVLQLAQRFDEANRVRDLLRTTVRADLAVAEWLLAWRGDTAAQAAGNRSRR